MASSKNRFIWKIEVYFGEGTSLGEHGLGYHIVDRMMRGLKHQGHYLIVDNQFASINLLHHLMENGIWATGNIKKTSKNLSSGLYRESKPQVWRSMLIRIHVHMQMGLVS